MLVTTCTRFLVHQAPNPSIERDGQELSLLAAPHVKRQASAHMRRFALVAIRLYQRFVSPYKGFRCAYSVHTGCASCSSLGYRAVRRYGVIGGISLLRARTYRCGVAHRRYADRCRRPPNSQRGDCDLGCDAPGDCGFDLPSGRGASRICDFASCCDCGGCDWPERKRKNSEKEKHVYIPPKIRSRVESSRNDQRGRDASQETPPK